MSAMHAGVMTTSTEMMYAQHVTLTQKHRYVHTTEYNAPLEHDIVPR